MIASRTSSRSFPRHQSVFALCSLLPISTVRLRTVSSLRSYVTVDNQKAAVDQAYWYDPDVNPPFVEVANHWGFTVIPARSWLPRDKGANESAIGVVQRHHEKLGRQS